jgi:hypothetical protein
MVEKAKCDLCGQDQVLIGHIINASNKKHNVNISMHLAKLDFDLDMTIDAEFGICSACFKTLLSELASGDASWEISGLDEGF